MAGAAPFRHTAQREWVRRPVHQRTATAGRTRAGRGARGPITSDGSWDDTLAVALDGGVAVRLAGPDTPGASFAEMSPDLRQALGTADLVITKGQANYYVFSAYRSQVAGQVIGLYTIKCEAVARAWTVPPRSMIAALL